MNDALDWIALSDDQPHDSQQVWARIARGQPHKVTFYDSPQRWEGASIIYEFDYFWEWAPLEVAKQALKKSA